MCPALIMYLEAEFTSASSFASHVTVSSQIHMDVKENDECRLTEVLHHGHLQCGGTIIISRSDLQPQHHSHVDASLVFSYCAPCNVHFEAYHKQGTCF